jgi:hypothetical protein
MEACGDQQTGYLRKSSNSDTKQSAMDPCRANAADEVQSHPLESYLWFREGHPFVLFKPLFDYMRLIHIMENSALLKVYQFKCKFHPKTPSQKHPE